jgi:hypothetical protein
MSNVVTGPMRCGKLRGSMHELRGIYYRMQNTDAKAQEDSSARFASKGFG